MQNGSNESTVTEHYDYFHLKKSMQKNKLSLYTSLFQSGLIGMTRNLAIDEAKHGVRVNW